jgi:hypothetical protein
MCGSGDRAGGSRVSIGRVRSNRFAMEIKPVRLASIYVEPRTIKRLKFLRKLYREASTNGLLPGEVPDKTADEMADDMINQVIEEKFPRVLELERALATVEQTFMRLKDKL